MIWLDRIVIEPTPHHTFPNTSFILFDQGFVFYVYYPHRCNGSTLFMSQTIINSKYIKKLNQNVLFISSSHSRVVLLLSPTVLFLMNSMITLMWTIGFMMMMCLSWKGNNGILECCIMLILHFDWTLSLILMSFLVIETPLFNSSLTSITVKWFVNRKSSEHKKVNYGCWNPLSV